MPSGKRVTNAWRRDATSTAVKNSSKSKHCQCRHRVVTRRRLAARRRDGSYYYENVWKLPAHWKYPFRCGAFFFVLARFVPPRARHLHLIIDPFRGWNSSNSNRLLVVRSAVECLFLSRALHLDAAFYGPIKAPTVGYVYVSMILDNKVIESGNKINDSFVVYKSRVGDERGSLYNGLPRPARAQRATRQQPGQF
ncbi:hypothetical protein EVAR_75396_1 [Eumeta japonica]|uniref:Uncharacterized protein n=1 Tax=Eumeta variegata TaxID=151549 RepID=A0A4C1TJV6_EUMVA|nr:hypothetical protein EVAR_75396_1 [Eumeta japonica]